MIKKIKVTNKNARTPFSDTTNGNVYSATEVPKGSKCPDGVIAIKGSLSFIDDVGDWATVYEDGNGYEVVEETQPEDDSYEIFKESIRGYKTPPTSTAESTAVAMGFEEVKGSTDLRLKCREAILSKKPSISTILQEAQQSILKHHGVTGKVKFTVTCSE